MREFVEFECTVPACKRRNYTATKNKKAHPERLEIKKFCPFCRKHTVHKEQK
jgi:large subunit ribosomal protein L33